MPAAAAAVGNEAAVHFFLSLGGNSMSTQTNALRRTNGFGNAVQAAASTGRAICVEILLSRADETFQTQGLPDDERELFGTEQGINRAIEFATHKRLTDTAALLIAFFLKYWPSSPGRRCLGCPFLVRAASSDNVSLVKALINRLPWKDNEKEACQKLHEGVLAAIEHGCTDIIRYSLESRLITPASTCPSNSTLGKSPIDLTALGGRRMMVNSFLSCGAAIESQTLAWAILDSDPGIPSSHSYTQYCNKPYQTAPAPYPNVHRRALHNLQIASHINTTHPITLKVPHRT